MSIRALPCSCDEAGTSGRKGGGIGFGERHPQRALAGTEVKSPAGAQTVRHNLQSRRGVTPNGPEPMMIPNASTDYLVVVDFGVGVNSHLELGLTRSRSGSRTAPPAFTTSARALYQGGTG